MTELEIKMLAKMRGQIMVYAVIGNKPRWLLTDKKNQKSTLRTLLESMSTDDWMDFQEDRLEIFDGLFRQMHPNKVYNWKAPATRNIFIREKPITKELVKKMAETIIKKLFNDTDDTKYRQKVVLKILKEHLNGKPVRL